MDRVDRGPTDSQPPQRLTDKTTEELRAIRLELAALRRLLDAFAGTFLNAKFPYGKATDRWGKR